MSEAVDQHELSLTPFDTRPVGAAVLRADRQFNIALVVATVVHVLFLTSFLSAEVRQLGDPSGARDGISVDLVTDADLQRMGTVADKAAGAPAPPTPPLPPEQAADRPPPAPPAPPLQQMAALPPEPPPPEPQAQEKAEPLPPEPRAPAPTETSSPPPEPQSQPKAVPPDPALEQILKIPMQAALPHNLDPPKPLKPPEPAKPARPAQPEEARPPQPQPQPKQRQRTSALDLTMPPSLFTAPSGGGGAGVERPAGITRSGENDAFARGVIAALQRTMPQLRDTRGRVTVRILLDKDGGIVRTDVVRPSSVANLDQSVVFATRQASFPFPPRNANSADLTFLVTYIYR